MQGHAPWTINIQRAANECGKKVENEDNHNKRTARVLLEKISRDTKTKIKKGHGTT